MGFFGRRSKLEKYLIGSTVLFLLLSVGLLIGLLIAKKGDDPELVCETIECLTAAAELQKSLNLSANPCEDFYEYACGGWMKNNIIGPDRSRWSQFDVTRKTLADRVRVLLEGEYNSKYPQIINQTINLYKKCMDITTRNNEGYTMLKDTLKEIEWPMINKGDLSGSYDWTKVFSNLNKKFGFSFILSNYVYLDAKNTSIYSLYIDAPSFGVGRAQLVNPNSTDNQKIIEAYKKFIDSSARLLADSSSDIDPNLNAKINELVQFEINLASITADSASRRNRTNLYGNKTTIDEFMGNYESIPLLSIENSVFGDSLNGIISGSSGLVVYDRDYFKRLGQVLGSTKNETIANYLSWRLVKSLGSYTTKDFLNIEFEYNKVVTGVEEPKALWEDCVDIVNNRLTFVVGRLYVDEYFKEEGKKDMNDMIDQLNEAFKQLLNDNDWMEDVTKEEAREKLKEMLRSIAYPDFITNDTKLNEYHYELNLEGTSAYFQSIQEISRWSTIKSLVRLANNVTLVREDLDWSTGPAIVNAFFSPNINRITFPAGILQSPFYTLGLPISLNLGAIGVVIGHEITHSFDDSGSQYDKYGNLENWWDEKTKALFNQRVKCFIDQYSSYNDSLAEMPINGSTTIGENIADNGGLRQAFRALQNYGGTKQLLPASMKIFTSEQLFFLSFANVWCTNIRREALINQIETDPHSPGKYRIWGSVSNSEGFAKAFDCKTGEQMNRNDKCILW